LFSTRHAHLANPAEKPAGVNKKRGRATSAASIASSAEGGEAGRGAAPRSLAKRENWSMEEWEATVDALLETAPMPRTDDEIDAFGKLITAIAWRKSGKLRTEGRAIGTIRKNMLALTNGAVAGSAQWPACFKNDKEK